MSENNDSVSFSEYFQNARDAAIIVMDQEGIIVETNFGFYHSYGYTVDDLKGKHFSILFTQEDKDRNLPEVELKTVHQENHASDNNYIIHKSGSKIWSHGETTKTTCSNGEIRLVKVIFDINQQKILEDFLAKANEKLKSKNDKLKWLVQDLDNFVYTASHDLKAPIKNIEALVKEIEEEASEETKKESKTEFDLLEKSLEKFMQVISDLSSSAKGEDIEFKKKKDVDFEDIVEEVKNSLHKNIIDSNSLFIEDYSKAPRITISKKNLRSVLYNLISNAIKYHSPERRPVINLRSYKKDGATVLEVEDNGLGIREEDKPSVFNIYQRLHTHVEGTGVGMSLVKRIIDSYNGKIELESEEGKGSLFRVIIPDQNSEN